MLFVQGPANPYGGGGDGSNSSGHEQATMMEEGNNEKINELSSRVARMKQVPYATQMVFVAHTAVLTELSFGAACARCLPSLARR